MNFITIDLGGTNTRIAHATGLDQPTFDEAPIRRKNTHTYEDDISFIIEAARSFSGGKPIDALGIGVPGRVDDQKLDMVASNNLPEWAGRNFAVDLSKALPSIYR
jgi:predicted NBD/HSP70 family sugar kinase